MTAGDAMTVSQFIQPGSIALHRRKREVEDLYFPHAATADVHDHVNVDVDLHVLVDVIGLCHGPGVG